ncbi:MAG: membrane protein insertion efficiency factor YidD [Candidatus Latescibacter sp.]|nr:membrane protein insertion efficiency factor YidD [Candidatus Latescibacter sp.]
MLKKIFIGIIKVYQMILSPFMGGQCRYFPSCSHYAILALKKDGVFLGAAKSIWRILRCNPFSKGGIDYP